ncbi:hypothetical protein Cs7R123_47790 [Catellatospora sp. TT07R-123]|uniref:hypothetical protein n=1 Tax=Catellatospora sp. TT07R-123 TaxID=2733863 RepID=UPI001B1B6507|nr:hypothetical protein [Catellatospora sp. TT07R-123]GHJ47437.1 hypothetical protein Cs7R123_47790 [Catellatospora sp. TT07R-123]
MSTTAEGEEHEGGPTIDLAEPRALQPKKACLASRLGWIQYQRVTAMFAKMCLAAPAEQHAPQPKTRIVARFGWSLYQQVTAVFATIGLAALADHWWHIGWRGVLGDLVGFWSQTVRPAVAAVFHILVTVPLGWMHVHFEVPLAARDYMSVGLMLLLSAIRAGWWSTVFELPGRRWDRNGLMDWPLFFLVAWPLMVLNHAWRFYVRSPLRERRKFKRMGMWDESIRKSLRRQAAEYFRIQVPLFYLGLLLALNYCVLR